MRTPLTIREVGRMFGHELPADVGKAKCPMQKHDGRQDKTFRVWRSRGGESICGCWSCSDGSFDGDNCGDAVWLYSKLAGVSRKEAWKKLFDEGWAVPGARDEDGDGARPRPAHRPSRPAGPKVYGMRGAPIPRVLPLDQEKLAAWSKLDSGVVEQFAKMRGMTAEHLRACGVIEMPSRCVGFVYRDPSTGVACRIKCRPIDRKTFWMEPRAAEGEDAKALAPLYLASDLPALPSSSGVQWVAMVEGEVDAISLRAAGLDNVVSLPDGYASSTHVSLEPLWGLYDLWCLATDKDDQGEKAARTLRDRAAMLRTSVVRVSWSRLEGDEVQTYKDANDALVAGFTREDFLACFDQAAVRQVGFPICGSLRVA